MFSVMVNVFFKPVTMIQYKFSHLHISLGQVDALRLRLEEKEATLNKKSKQIQEMSEEKGTLNGEIHDLKDMLEVKERKVNVLQKKVI